MCLLGELKSLLPLVLEVGGKSSHVERYESVGVKRPPASSGVEIPINSGGFASR